jgi:Ca-activated chloride channel family protein
MTNLSPLGAFHFLRPEWLLALFPVAMLVAFAWRALARGRADEWAGAVDSHLLKHLTVQGAQAGRSRGLATAFGAALVAAVLAMAGPTWTKAPVPAFEGNAPTVIVLSLAQSMNGTDLVPSRLTRAGHKLRDILDRVRGDDTAMVIYSDRPFVASPLTSDSAVIRQMLPELSTGLMPVLGNRLDLALIEAQGLIQRAGADRGTIVVLADDPGQDPQASLAAARAAVDAGLTVNVLGVGTEAGSVLQTAQGKAIHLGDGKEVTMHLDTQALHALAQAGGGSYAAISADDSDLQALLPIKNSDLQTAGKAADATSDAWQDMGYWLLLIPVLLAPMAFRRGMLFALMLGLSGFLMAPHGAQAGTWDDLWLTPDQQGQRAFDKGDFAAASNAYQDTGRKAAALYRSGDYAAASGDFTDSYNRGNALARAGELEAALAAYDERLTAAPDDADAKFNRDLVAKLLEQQKQEDQQKQDQKPQSGDQKDKQQDQAQGGQDQPKDQSGDQQAQGGQQPQPGDGGKDQAGQQASDSSAKDQPKEAAGKPSQPKADGSQTAGNQGAQPSEETQGEAPGQSQANASQAKPDSAAQQQSADKADQAPKADGPTTDQATDQAKDQPTDQGTDTKASGFSDQMDQTLAAKSGQAPQPQPDAGSEVGAGGMAKLDQAAEQQLRAVPDDPSGLLRARIRQHYARQLAANR